MLLIFLFYFFNYIPKFQSFFLSACLTFILNIVIFICYFHFFQSCSEHGIDRRFCYSFRKTEATSSSKTVCGDWRQGQTVREYTGQIIHKLRNQGMTEDEVNNFALMTETLQDYQKIDWNMIHISGEREIRKLTNKSKKSAAVENQ